MFGPMPSWSCVAGAFGEDEVRAVGAKWRGSGSPHHSQKAERHPGARHKLCPSKNTPRGLLLPARICPLMVHSAVSSLKDYSVDGGSTLT